jgi:hypothetical protein
VEIQYQYHTIPGQTSGSREKLAVWLEMSSETNLAGGISTRDQIAEETKRERLNGVVRWKSEIKFSDLISDFHRTTPFSLSLFVSSAIWSLVEIPPARKESRVARKSKPLEDANRAKTNLAGGISTRDQIAEETKRERLNGVVRWKSEIKSEIKSLLRSVFLFSSLLQFGL